MPATRAYSPDVPSARVQRATARARLPAMAVTFELVQDFPAGLAELWRTLGQRDYVEKKYRALGSSGLSIERLDRDASRIEVRLSRDVAPDSTRLPAWARWLSGGRQRVLQSTRWSRRSATRVDVAIDIGLPSRAVSALGRGGATEVGPNRTRLSVRFGVHCRLPLLDERIADLFGQQVRAALEADHAFTAGYLAAHRRPPSTDATPGGQSDAR